MAAVAVVCTGNVSIRAAQVGPGGYTNAFTIQPLAADWSTFSIAGGGADITLAAGLDSAVLAVPASSVNGATVANAITPPDLNVSATWASVGLHLQTRPTGNAATLLMCTLVNDLGVDASSVTVSYDFASVAPLAEDVDGVRGYYSLSGALNSWIVIPSFSTAVAGRPTATLNVNWPNGTPLYILWADDNGPSSPDTAFQIDNFSASATPGIQSGASIASQPQSVAVAELFPASFTVGVAGNPSPTIQWYSNNVAIPGATSATYNIASTPLNFHNLQFRAVAQNTASNVSYSVTSDVAVLTVNADSVKPVLLGASASGLSAILASFSEQLSAASVTSIASYSVTGIAGTLTILSAQLDLSQTNVILSVSPMSAGATYTLTLNNVADQSAAANAVLANSQAQFTALAIASADIGGPAVAGSSTTVAGGFNLTGAGTDIGGTADQFQFTYQPVSGDFDMKVRVASLTLTDPWAKAGLMARENATAGSRYAGTFATPSVSGAFFQYRAVTSGATTNTGAFPATYPNMWLRLKRVGSTFTSYASVSGDSWQLLGTLTMSPGASSQMLVGMAVTSRATNQLASAQFRSFENVIGNPPIATQKLNREPLSASSRRTGLVLSEIMYHPRENTGFSNQLEYIELFNSQAFPEAIGGYRISGAVDYTFPQGTVLKSGAYLVVARNPSILQSFYSITSVMGPWVGATTNGLPGDSGTVRLRNRQGAVLLEVPYEDKSPWPIAADGTGHSLVLSRASYGEQSVLAWATSDTIDGSPGRAEPVSADPMGSVVINEFLANSDAPLEDYIELYNHSLTPVDLSGAWLSDTTTTNKYRIPNGTTIGATSHVYFVESQFLFGLSSSGERILLVNSNQNRVIDAIDFEEQASGVSMGRWPNASADFFAQAARSAGLPNGARLIPSIVINEIMYQPISGRESEQYVELYNRTATNVNIGRWRFTSGISYNFASNTIVPPGGFVVVAKSRTNLLARYPGLNATNAFGDFDGSLAGGGERIALSRPELAISTNGAGSTNTIYVVANEVTYGDGGRWGDWSDGGGSSLELKDPHSDNRQSGNWGDSDETAKSSWTAVEFVGPTGAPTTSETLSFNGDHLQVFQLGVGECLLDEVEVKNGAGANLVSNPGFENGISPWVLDGSHDMSSIENIGFGGTKSLHVRAESRGDNGGNKLRIALSGAASGTVATPVTIRGKVRWLRGWPEILFRLRGGGAEALGRMALPTNLGTPGAPNSRLIANAGPAIYTVSHLPVMPAAGEDVVVSCRANDPNGLAGVTLRYRLENGSATVTPAMFTSLAMNDAGTGGDAIPNDGLYSATLSGQPAKGTISFYVEATDSLGATNQFPHHLFPTAGLPRCFPNDAVARECVLRWGDTQMMGSFATYHLWLTAANSNRWTIRFPNLNNSPLDGTFVYNNYRSVYNSLPQFAGSPWHRGVQTQGPCGTARCDFVQNFPPDDVMLGSTDFVLNNPGNPDATSTSDLSAQTEQTSYITFNEIGLVFNARRYVHHFVNGVHRSTTGNRPGNFIFEDSQQPNQEMVDQWFPDDTKGEMWKIEDWFEFNDNGFDFASNNDADLLRRTITLGGKEVLYPAPYRFMFRKRALSPGESANDYTNIFAMVDAVSPNANYGLSGASNSAVLPDFDRFASIIDYEQWMRIFAVQRAVGNWDSYGYARGKNDYAYIGRDNGARFAQLTWDIDFTMGVGGRSATGGLFDEVSDRRVAGMLSTPTTLRAYWRGLWDVAMGPFDTNFLSPVLFAKQAALLANNVNVDTGVVPNTILTFAAARRTFLLSQMNNITNNFNVAGLLTFSTNASLVTIGGYAPIQGRDIYINGALYPVTWTSVTSWVARVVLGAGVNTLVVDNRMNTGATNGTRTLSINYTGPSADPAGSVVFNEIHYNPTIPDASFMEIVNVASNAFDVSGWELNGLDYTFPVGSILTNGQNIVLVKNRIAYGAAYPTGAVFGVFEGNLDLDGEIISLIKPGTNEASNVVIDRVRYENRLPWPTAANGAGFSLQLMDARQDNSRSSSWASQSDWTYVSYTGTIQSNGTSFLIFLNAAGDVYIDDLVLVTNTVAEVGPNLLLNGGFESPLGAEWTSSGNHITSVRSTTIARSGTSSLRVIGTGAGGPAASVKQIIAALPATMPCTLSFWYLPSINGSSITLRTTPGSLFISTTSYRPLLSTPGIPNSVARPLPAYDPLWLNELQAANITGIQDNMGDRDPWVELYNGGTNVISLDGYYLANNYDTNLTQWPFPAGQSIAPGKFLIVWADGETNETSGTNLHTSFRLNSTTGSVALVRITNSAPQITDYLTYNGLGADLSYGDFPDGQPFTRKIFQAVTARGTNEARGVNVFINEWMASNTNFISDPTDGNFDDWFELYNASDVAVDLSGYYLTDNTNNRTQFQIPNNGHYVIPPFGFLLVWADNDSSDNSTNQPDLHVSFGLAKSGESLGLYGPDGTTRIDSLAFGAQVDNVSEGRFADGAAPRYSMNIPTPRGPNQLALGNTPPQLAAIPSYVIRLGQSVNFTALGTDSDVPAQTLTYTLGATPLLGVNFTSGGLFSWTPAANQVPSTNSFAITVTDNGVPQQSASRGFTIIVLPQPLAGINNDGGGNISISFDTIVGRSYRVEYKNNLDDLTWLPLTPNVVATDATLTVPDTIGALPHRFYRIFEVN